MASPADIASCYDALHYPSRALPQTHPGALATAAALAGLSPAPPGRCRVLELGCGDGSNLLPMAAMFPGSRFVGVDISSGQIAQGRSIVDELALGNLELRAADFMALDASVGEFDYILCHGVYSWVPPAVQEGILAICGRRLSPRGVACVSYSTYPGAHRRQALREMMLYHTASIADRGEAARQALGLLEFLRDNTADPRGTYARVLHEEGDHLRKLPLGHLAHDLLDPENNPCYFHEFMARAGANGLQFLSEAEGKGGAELLPEPAQRALAKFGDDVIRREQYIDFLHNTSLRSTLLCREGLPVERPLKPERLRDFLVACVAHPLEENADVAAEQPLVVRTRFGSATVNHAPLKAALLALYRARPWPLSIDALAGQMSRLLRQPIGPAEACEAALYGRQMALVGLRSEAPAGLAAQIEERPRATPLARLQARRALPVTSLLHEPVPLEPLERWVLERLDGTSDVPALAAALIDAAREGALPGLPGELSGATSPGQWAPPLVPRILARLFALGLLSS